MQQLRSIRLKLFEKLHNKRYRDSFFEQEFLDDNATSIRQLRKLRKMRQIDVASATGMKQSAVSRLEQAEYSSWTCKTLLRLAQALDAKIAIRWIPAEIAIEQYKFLDDQDDDTAVLNKARMDESRAHTNRPEFYPISFSHYYVSHHGKWVKEVQSNLVSARVRVPAQNHFEQAGEDFYPSGISQAPRFHQSESSLHQHMIRTQTVGFADLKDTHLRIVETSGVSNWPNIHPSNYGASR